MQLPTSFGKAEALFTSLPPLPSLLPPPPLWKQKNWKRGGGGRGGNGRGVELSRTKQEKK